MLLFLMFVLAILAVCVYVLLQQQSPRPPKAKGGHNNGPPRKVLPVR
jgi:preprotein translocase subunit SecG